jgi:hypothetical protein
MTMPAETAADRDRPEATDTFDWTAPAEMFLAPAKTKRWGPPRYRRFDTAAQAIQFAIEDLSAPLLNGTVMEVLEERFDRRAMRDLYDRSSYPLVRKE